MKDKFDHKLINKIKGVFGSLQPDFNPQDWEKLMDKLPEKKTRFVALPWTMVKAAAVILFAVVGSYLLWNGLADHQPQINDNKLISQTNQDTIKIRNEKFDHHSDTSNNIIQKYLTEESYSNKANKAINNINKLSKVDHHQQPKQIAETTITSTNKPAELIIIKPDEPDSTTPSIPVPKDILADSHTQKSDSVTKQIIVTAQQTDAKIEIPPEVIEIKTRQKQKVRLGLEFASFANYSPEDIVPNMNYGGGLVAHVPIKNRFSFNTGIIVSVYNIEFSDNEKVMDYVGGDYLGGDSLVFASVSDFKDNYPDVQPSEMNLTGLDIPVNFQYQFIRRKSSGFFVELGFSSLFYLSEKYSYTFVTLSENPNINGEYEVEETATEDISDRGLKTFDFAKLINFSIGVDYRLSKRLDLTINPYLKYPVSTLSSGDMKFGSGGLKLKFMIKPGK